MRLYLDDNITDRRVVAHLLRLGHTVLVPAEVGHAGALDATYLAYAIRHGVVLLTQDYQDFAALHDLILAAGGRYSGILLLYTENDPTRDMTPRSIAVAMHETRDSSRVPGQPTLCGQPLALAGTLGRIQSVRQSEATVMQVRIASGRGILMLGLCLLSFSVYRAHATYRFVKSSVPATGTVWYGSKRMFLVEIPATDGTARYIPTRMPLLALPWSYVRGKTVTILYDPTKTYEDSNPFALFPERARVDAWFHLWLLCLFTGGLGGVLLTFGCLQVTRPRRWRTSISLYIRR